MYVFAFRLINKTDDNVKGYFTPTILSKKCQTSLFSVIFNTFVLLILLNFLKNSHRKFKCNPTHS